MTFPNFRATHSADWRPEAPGAQVACLAPNKLGSALAQQMPGRQVGCTVMLSLLLASCAYRQDATGVPAAAQGGETATPGAAGTPQREASPDSPREEARDAAVFHASGLSPKRSVSVDVTLADTMRNGSLGLPPAWTGYAAEDVPVPEAPGLHLPLDTSAPRSSAPVPAPATALLDIDRTGARHWIELSPWYALPVVLALGMPLLGIMGRRGPRRAPATRREPTLSAQDMQAQTIGHALGQDFVMSIPMGIGAMRRVPWSPVADPLSREDWSLALSVRYAPLDEKRPVFSTRTSYAVQTAHAGQSATPESATNAPASVEPTDHGGIEGADRAMPVADLAGTHAPPADAAATFAGPSPRQPIISEEDIPAESTAHQASDAKDMHPAPPMTRIEAILADVMPEGHVFLDFQDGLPTMTIAGDGVLPPERLAKLEAALLDIQDADGTQATWLLTQVLALRMAHAGRADIDALHRAATSLALHGMERAADEARGHWRARLIELDLARAACHSGASRLLALRHMAARHADVLEAGDGAVIKAWVGVLLHWAQHQIGDSALDRFTEAAALAERLRGMPGWADEGQFALADVLLRRARVEHGGVRARTLAQAQHLLDALFERAPTGRAALAVAEAALERARHAPAHAVGEALSHALAHAFLAGSDPRWHAASLRLRLAIQLAYEALPDMPVQGSVALDLARKLDRLPAPPAEAIESMAMAFIRHGEHGRACRLCAEAWQAGAQAPNLLETWRQASVQWARNLTSPHSRSDWQDNERQRRVATQMQ